MGSDFPEILEGTSYQKRKAKGKVPMSVKYRPLSENEMHSYFPVKVGEFQEGSFHQFEKLHCAALLLPSIPKCFE